jgi:hypothetical protein
LIASLNDNTAGEWGVCFFSEVDAKLKHFDDQFWVEEGDYLWMRYWPGAGSHAMGVAIPKNFKKYVTEVTWRGRCCGLSMRILSEDTKS